MVENIEGWLPPALIEIFEGNIDFNLVEPAVVFNCQCPRVFRTTIGIRFVVAIAVDSAQIRPWNRGNSPCLRSQESPSPGVIPNRSTSIWRTPDAITQRSDDDQWPDTAFHILAFS